ncbi:MAG TPA: hypothetical protein VIB49_07160 [Thermoplasmata archaeon]|jgi:hypothetical protein
MDPILQFLTQPLVVVLIAIGVFVGRVMFLARRLKAAARNPSLADLRALEEAKGSLEKHRDSLEAAKGTLRLNLGTARDTLRTYKGPLNEAIEGRRRDIEVTMKALEASKDAQKKEFDKVRKQTAFEDAKRSYKLNLPRKARRSPTKEM